jgi:hypothetical protein
VARKSVTAITLDRERPPQLDRDALAAAERRLERLAWLLDAQFVLPGTGFRFGADAILGLVPGVGDAIGAGLSAWLIVEAQRLGAPNTLLARMVANLMLDAAVGAVPVLGDVFDAAFKANLRNMRLLRRHLEEVRARTPIDITPRR